MKPIKNVGEAGHTDSGKKAYQKPQLEVFGNLGDVTETVGNTTFVADGGTMAHSKTA